MNPQQLWNDHTFRVLLGDLFKARKDEELGPIRLEAIFRYCGTEPMTQQAQPKPAANPNHPPRARPVPVAEVDEIPGASGEFALSEAEEPSAGGQSAAQYLEQQLAERNQRDPNASLKKAADIVQKAIESNGGGVITVQVPRNYSVSGLEAILKERRVSFVSLSSTIQPKQVHLDPKSASALSGAAGENNGGWTVTVQR